MTQRGLIGSYDVLMSDERDPNLLTPNEFEAQDGVEDWRITCDGVTATFQTASFASGTRFVGRIAELDGLGPWLPDVDLRHDTVTVRMLRVADDWYGRPGSRWSSRGRSPRSPRQLGLTPIPTAVQGDPLRRGGGRHPAARWRSGGPPSATSTGRTARTRTSSTCGDVGPSVWFEPLDVAREERNTIHVACWVPYEVAEARVAAALAAGGSIVREFAPMWWTLADPEGNEVDIATTRNRG